MSSLFLFLDYLHFYFIPYLIRTNGINFLCYYCYLIFSCLKVSLFRKHCRILIFSWDSVILLYGIYNNSSFNANFCWIFQHANANKFDFEKLALFFQCEVMVTLSFSSFFCFLYHFSNFLAIFSLLLLFYLLHYIRNSHFNQ